MPNNLWDILICSCLERHDKLNVLLADLYKQSRDYPGVNIITLVDDRMMGLDVKRTRLLRMSRAKYLNFIDDDDLVAPDYISQIHTALEGNVDYVGFQLQHYNKGVASKPTYHSLKYSDWSEDENGYYRGISHLNPIRREIAQMFDFAGNYGEDFDWSNRVQRSGLVKSERYIDKTMYHYYFDHDQSLAGPN